MVLTVTEKVSLEGVTGLPEVSEDDEEGRSVVVVSDSEEENVEEGKSVNVVAPGVSDEGSEGVEVALETSDVSDNEEEDDLLGIVVVLTGPAVSDCEEDEDLIGNVMVISIPDVGEPDAHSHEVLDSDVVSMGVSVEEAKESAQVDSADVKTEVVISVPELEERVAVTVCEVVVWVVTVSTSELEPVELGGIDR